MGKKGAQGKSGSSHEGADSVQGPETDGPNLKPLASVSPYDGAPIGLCYFDADLRWVHINEWLAAVNGPTVSDHLGRTIGELLPDLAQAVEGQLRHVLSNGEAVQAETLVAESPARPGIKSTFQHSFYPVRSSDGTVVGVSCAVQDVTEREAAKEELERYRSMVTASSSLMVLMDSTFTYRAVNQAYCDELRRTEDEILGHTVAEVLGEEDFEHTLRPYLERCLAGEQVIFGRWWDSPSRGRRHIDVRYDPFYGDDGSVSGVLLHARDTTERKEMDDQLRGTITELEVANQELKAFSDALAHDLRSPLLIVTNFSHQLREALAASLDKEHLGDLERVSSAGLHMTHIIDDLRDLADVNRSEISREETDLSVLAREIIENLKRLAPNRDVRFEAEPGIKAVGDKTLLRILLTNLLQNAWKYTGHGHDAWIELGVIEDEDEGPIYHVRDNGIGFDNANKEIIFQAFERLHTRAEYSGSGLGLATVERIVRRHRGRVWADGALGEGAVFRFTLGSPGTETTEGERRRVER